ncbi:MAG: prepilin peptidase [Patescibacteria group bacterium]
MQYLFDILIFLFGAALGSFLNVIADRYNTGLPWWQGKSFCFSCNEKLRIIDLFPVLSFLFLKGRCRYCGSRIPREAFIVEIVMGSLSILAAVKIGLIGSDFSLILNSYFLIQYFVLIAIFSILFLITLYDLRHFIIPNSFLIILFLFSFTYNSISTLSLNPYPLILAFLSGVILALPFLLLFLISRGRWLGLGDVKYIAVMGFLLGISNGVSAIFLAFWIGALYALFALYVSKKKLTMKSEVPFGPFLSLGTAISLCIELDLLHLNDLSILF